MKPIGVVDYTTAYGKPLPQDPFAMLRPYPTDLIVAYLAKINVILFQEPDCRSQAIKIFEHVFLKPQASTVDYQRTVDQLLSHEHQVIFAVQSISYLIKESLLNFRAAEGPEIDLKLFNRNMFDTILIYNKIVYDTDGTQLESYEGLWQIALRQQVYIRDFNALFYTVPIKFLLINRYFDSTPEGRQIMASFQKQLGLGQFWNFASTFMRLMQGVLGNERTGQYIFQRDQVPPQALELFSFDKSANRDQLSIHKDIIPKPFYELDENNYAVIDFSYFRYLLDQGVFWTIFFNSSLNQGDVGRQFNIFRSTIGKDYFERFLVGNLMKALYNKKHHVVIDCPPYEDLWIRPNQKDLIILEIKMADLNPLTSEGFDVQRFRDFIISNYAKPKDEKGGAKGAFQLARQLRLLENSKADALAKLKIGALKKLNVYPVIIYSDQALDVVCVNSLVKNIFEEYLAEEPGFSFTIKPLVMIGINTILEQFCHFTEDPTNFLALIRGYQAHIRGKQKDYLRFGGPFLYYEQHISFAEYANKVKGRPKDELTQNIQIFKKLINSGHFGPIDKPLQ
jgi:hypothetical protein